MRHRFDPGLGRSPEGGNGNLLEYSSILAWRFPWSEDPGRLQSIGSQRVIHDLGTKQQVKALSTFKHNITWFNLHFRSMILASVDFWGTNLERGKPLGSCWNHSGTKDNQLLNWDSGSGPGGIFFNFRMHPSHQEGLLKQWVPWGLGVSHSVCMRSVSRICIFN